MSAVPVVIKATLPSHMQPVNPYAKGTPERTFFGLFVSWFYFPRGPFPNNSANETGAVPLSRLMSTSSAKKFVEKNPDFANLTKIKSVLEGAFEIIERSPTNIYIKALPHAHGWNFTGGKRKKTRKNHRQLKKLRE